MQLGWAIRPAIFFNLIVAKQIMDYEESDWDDDFDSDEDDNFDDEDDASETISCPECGTDIYEDADSCPQCGVYIHHGYRAGHGSGWWTFGGAIDEWAPFWIFLAVAGVLGVVFSLMMF